MKYILTISLFVFCSQATAQKKVSKPVRQETKDTVITDTYYDTVVCAIYIMKCDTCEPVIHAAFKVRAEYNTYTLRMKKNKTSGQYEMPLMWSTDFYPGPKQFIKYLRYDKTELDKNWVVLQEKILY